MGFHIEIDIKLDKSAGAGYCCKSLNKKICPINFDITESFIFNYTDCSF